MSPGAPSFFGGHFANDVAVSGGVQSPPAPPLQAPPAFGAGGQGSVAVTGGLSAGSGVSTSGGQSTPASIYTFDVQRDFGAKGDGVANDTAALQAARNAQKAADGGTIYLRRGTYLFDQWDLTGPTPAIIIGEGSDRTQLQTTGAQPVVAILLGDPAAQVGTRLEHFWLHGTPQDLGGMQFGDPSKICAFTRLNGLRVSGFTRAPGVVNGVYQYGGFGVSLDQVQELDGYNCRLDANYNNIHRPNWGYVTATGFRGWAGYIGKGTNRGANLSGAISDITFDHITCEGNNNEGIADRSDPGQGTVTAVAGAVTFSQTQAGYLHNRGYIAVNGNLYAIANFDGATHATITSLTGPLDFAASAFRLEFASLVVIHDVYFEANGQTTGNPNIRFSGSAATYGFMQFVIERCKWHGTGVKMQFDYVARSVVRDSPGLAGGDIVDTINSNVRYEGMAQAGAALDISGIYATLLGNNSYDDIDRTTPSVNRFLAGLGRLIMGAASRVNMAVGDIVIPNGRALKGAVVANNDTKALIALDLHNVVRVGAQDGAGTWSLVGIGAFASVNLPAAGPANDGAIALDTTNARLVYYANGFRYWIPIGTSF